MLARANRVVRASDFRETVRAGRRFVTPHAHIYVAGRAAGDPTRFGFIVSRAVGNAVTRNLVTRRLRSVGFQALATHGRGRDVVVRALPGASEASWTTLHSEILDGLERSGTQQ